MAYKKRDKYAQYTTVSHTGTRLIRQHGLSKYGVWEIKGEDSNAELYGQHHQPDLGLVEGILDDVIKYAIEHPRFWVWGGGGDIKLRADVISAKIKVPIPPEGDEMSKFKDQLKNEEVGDPTTLLPTASDVLERIKAKQEQDQSLTYGMINTIKTVLDETEVFPVTIRFTRDEIKNKAQAVISVLESQGFFAKIESSKSETTVKVIISIP